nr:putative protein CRIPAK [Oryctolagus cuniculus]
MRPARCLPQPLMSQPRAPRHSLVVVTPHLLDSLLSKSWRDPGEKQTLSCAVCTHLHTPAHLCCLPTPAHTCTPVLSAHTCIHLHTCAVCTHLHTCAVCPHLHTPAHLCCLSAPAHTCTPVLSARTCTHLHACTHLHTCAVCTPLHTCPELCAALQWEHLSSQGWSQLPRPNPESSQVLPDPCSPKPHVLLASTFPAHREVLGCVGAPVCTQRPREASWSFCMTPGEPGTAVPMACREGRPQPCRTLPQNADLRGPVTALPPPAVPHPPLRWAGPCWEERPRRGQRSALAGLDSWASASWWLRRHLLLGGSQRL